MAALSCLDDIRNGVKLVKRVPSAPPAADPAGNSVSSTIAARRGFSLEDGDPDEILKYQRYILEFNLERWLGRLEGHTFGTTNVEFGPDVAQELVARYEKLKGYKQNMPACEELLSLAIEGNDISMEYPGLADLMSRLEGIVNGSGAFVKTSSRSAKDFADLPALKQAFEEVLERLGTSGATDEEDPGGVSCENTAMIAMSYASMSLLKSNGALEVINTFSQSERIWHDMELALAAQGPTHGHGDANDGASEQAWWEESLVVRSWVQLEPDMEFRCFVVGGQLTAISQYRHLIHFPRLCANWTEGAGILSALVDAFETELRDKLAGCFPRDDYILDLAVQLAPTQDSSTIMSAARMAPDDVTKVWVVEANPFFETTDGCLYSWQKDFEYIMGPPRPDGPPVDSRLTIAPKKGASSLIYADWKSIVDGSRPG